VNNPTKIQDRVGVLRVAGLFCLFFLISWGLGYPILNRYDPRQVPGLTDVKSYAALVTGASVQGPDHLRYRVLVPWMARPFYRAAQGRVSSWDPLTFGLLVADSLFVAATAALIVVLGTSVLGCYSVSLVAALLYLLNFCVPNMRLAGLVDAGEGFFVLLMLWALWERMAFLLPVITMIGVLAKETFIPVSVAFTAAWWIVARKELKSPARDLLWIASGWVAGLLMLIGAQWSTIGYWPSPLEFGRKLHQNHEYIGHLISSLLDRNLWYIFCWLLPTAIPNLNKFPKSLLVATAAAGGMVFVLDGYYGGAPGTVGRALFSVAGPLLALSSALFVLNPKLANSARSEQQTNSTHRHQSATPIA